MKKTLFIAAMALSVTGFAQKVNGKLSFPKGQKLELTTETKKTATTELMGQTMESTVNSSVTEVFNIEDANANGATIAHNVKRIVFTANGMGNSQSFDSEKEEDRKGEMGKIMEKALKNNYKITVDPYGAITAVTPADSAKDSKDAEAEAMTELVSTQLGLKLGTPKQGEVSVFKILPSKEIAQGDSWTDSSSANGQKRTTVYKVNSITANEILLDYTEDININTTQQIMGTEASIQSDDKVAGQITLDKNT
ncbi:MAG: DUF6263 family protein, partial [Flavisolibacter sp.]